MGKVQLARQLRRKMTWDERRLWHRLRGRKLRGARFRRQHPIGAYVVDFACLGERLAIEIDGGSHVGKASPDARRAEVLRGMGYRVLRFTSHEVTLFLEDVVKRIEVALASPGGSAGTW